MICLCGGAVWSQSGTFAFASKASGQAEKGKATDYKYTTAKKVFDALVDGQGDFRQRRPELVMKNSERYVAWAMPGKAEIGLEELAYDICASFGADSLNALAALLTHELVHYYEKHDWSRHFVKQNEDLPTAQKLEKLEEGLKLEAQADYLGGFMAYSVGFQVHGVMPELLKKVYAETGYDLPEEIEGYPSLKDRIAMSEQAMSRLAELQVVFEMATYLNLLGYYEDADLYYQYILGDFQSRDIYNNAGVTALLTALPHFTKKEMPYGLPIELDPKSRLETNNTRVTDQERKERIQRALDYFDRALLLDQHYAPAFLNKAAAYVLQEDWEEANYWIRKASKEELNEKMSADLLVLKGIIAARQEDPEGAREWWEQAAEKNSDLAGINLQVLKDGPLQEQSNAVMGFVTKTEQIEDLEIEQYLVDTAPDQVIEINVHKACGFHLREHSRIFSHLVDGGKEYLIVQVVGPDFTGSTMEGIEIGEDLQSLEEKYGVSDQRVQTPEGVFVVYPERSMFFQLHAEDGVQGWGIYRLKKK
ncbi:hypothetical protein CRP01_25355 [Flavilitoribacter nigricans DSM 23189 = NBRC 102662]|uniref:Uncharacterized protein n=2 Tax=Flavilitoribacter TaxID=2762562 RepID=A0A2D0N4Y2_FLAN2|nr:hypothetical protein CRP01_25355 [Flavilitoribacter nigricans DSM 23189 = NBRC 102662]